MPATGPKGGLLPTSIRAGAAVSQYRAIKRGADMNTGILGTANAVIIGVSEDEQTNVGRPFRLAHRPGELVLVEAGAAVALDVSVASDATGRAVLATTGQNGFGITRQAATAAGDLITVELRPHTAP